MNNFIFKAYLASKAYLRKSKSTKIISITVLFISFVLVMGFRIVKAQPTEEQDADVSATVTGPTATPTTSPSASGTPSPTPTLTPKPTYKPGATPVPTAAPSPAPTGIFKIYGYAPSNSKIYMTGIAVSEETVSLSDGYFEFNRLFFPTFLSFLSGNKYPELCLFSQDQSKRLTSSVCIPSLPLSAQTSAVGPILLSPTFDIERGIFNTNEQTKATGKTLPNTQVEIFIAREKQGSSFFNIVRSVWAYYIPTYQLTSNEDGNFEFNLPNDPDIWRVFAIAKVQNNFSAKSNTLTFSISPSYLRLLMIIIQFLKDLLIFIIPNWIYFVVLIQIVIIALLVRHITRRRKNKKVKKVAKRKLTNQYYNIVAEYKKLLIKPKI
ncbi:hypothetical protein A2W13_00030 [Candidatus Woesebacteria bacterium RBG_16_36_11]|uniref:Uncharacterized protein n=1 Tax=Candidatus Woesebacteria bacterium RBG_16_36_11 TaxID=1802481 RepID=A0A1F7XCL6_9BACT|nr:MAG: hypothetical protein A2W13_00030 [Candidatus Woesebacteria bacterium RBG_16_36_11]